MGALSATRTKLTEFRQYLLALVAALGGLAGIQAAARKITWSEPFVWLALMAPLLVFLYKTVPRWRRARLERSLVRRSQQVEAAPRNATEPLGGYFLIGPHNEERRQLFRRADGVQLTVLRWIRQSRESVLVLTGTSGTGKTSLIQAFVIPELREGTPPYTVLLLRSFEDPLAELRRRLVEPGVIWTKPPAGLEALTWETLLPRAVEQLRRKNSEARLVLVFDQFEEFVILDPTGGGKPRAAEMRAFLHCLQRQAPDGFTLLLALRSDYKTFLEQLGVPPLQQGTNWQEVSAFRQSDAAEFLSMPESGFQMPAERLQYVLTEAAALDGTRGLIRPIILNMLGVVLRRIAGGPEAERPTRTLLADDLRRVVNDPRLRDLARPILLRMLTDADTKRPRTIGEIAAETGLDPHAVQGCLLDLELAGYVRPLSRSDELAARVWEISHDFVARLLGPILKTPLRAFWERESKLLYRLSFVLWAVGVIAVPFLARREPQVLPPAVGAAIWRTDNLSLPLTAETRAFVLQFLISGRNPTLDEEVTITDPEASQRYRGLLDLLAGESLAVSNLVADQKFNATAAFRPWFPTPAVRWVEDARENFGPRVQPYAFLDAPGRHWWVFYHRQKVLTHVLITRAKSTVMER